MDPGSSGKDKTYLYFCMEKPSEHIFNEKNKNLDALAAEGRWRKGSQCREFVGIGG